MEDIKFICLLPEKDIKLLKADEFEGKISFYPTIEACLYNEISEPGKYYVYIQNEFEISYESGTPISPTTIITFSKCVSVKYIGCVEYIGLCQPVPINCSYAIGVDNPYIGYDYKWIERKNI